VYFADKKPFSQINNVTSFILATTQILFRILQQPRLCVKTNAYIFSLYLIVGILEVLRTDFPEAYKSVMVHPLLYPYLHYPLYRYAVY
jgi:hypothetical protein